MKEKKLFVCAFAAALLLAGCGSEKASAKSSHEETTAATTAAETTTTTAETTTTTAETTAEAETTTKAAKKKTTAAQTTVLYKENDEESIYKYLCGRWKIYDAEADYYLTLTFSDGRTFFLQSGDMSAGSVRASNEGGSLRFYLDPEEGSLIPDTYVMPVAGRVGVLAVNNDLTGEESLAYMYSDLTADFAGEAGIAGEDVIAYTPDSPDENAQTVAFTATRPVTDLKLMKLEMTGASDSGQPIFTETELFKLDKLDDDKSFTAPLSFPGDSPSYGISYVDKFGVLRKFAVSISGKDGGLELSAY